MQRLPPSLVTLYLTSPCFIQCTYLDCTSTVQTSNMFSDDSAADDCESDDDNDGDDDVESNSVVHSFRTLHVYRTIIYAEQ